MERNLFFCVGSIAQIAGVRRFSHLFSTVSRKKRQRQQEEAGRFPVLFPKAL
jgi:hypothetical protein